MKRLIRSYINSDINQVLKKLHKRYNTNNLYVDYNNLNEDNLVDEKTMKSYYEDYENNETNPHMSYIDWKNEVLKNGDLEEFTINWIEDYIKSESPEIIKRDFPTIYKF